MPDDIRWVQRFNIYRKAFAALKRSVFAAQERDLNEVEEQGVVHGFEFTFGLSWKLLKTLILFYYSQVICLQFLSLLNKYSHF